MICYLHQNLHQFLMKKTKKITKGSNVNFDVNPSISSSESIYNPHP